MCVPAAVAARKHVLFFEQFRESVNLISGDGDAPSVAQALSNVFDCFTQPAREPRRLHKIHGARCAPLGRPAVRQATESA